MSTGLSLPLKQAVNLAVDLMEPGVGPWSVRNVENKQEVSWGKEWGVGGDRGVGELGWQRGEAPTVATVPGPKSGTKRRAGAPSERDCQGRGRRRERRREYPKWDGGFDLIKADFPQLHTPPERQRCCRVRGSYCVIYSEPVARLLTKQAGWVRSDNKTCHQLHRLSGVSDFPAITC